MSDNIRHLLYISFFVLKRNKNDAEFLKLIFAKSKEHKEACKMFMPFMFCITGESLLAMISCLGRVFDDIENLI